MRCLMGARPSASCMRPRQHVHLWPVQRHKAIVAVGPRVVPMGLLVTARKRRAWPCFYQHVSRVWCVHVCA